MRILGIDFGEKRIGVAICDPTGFIARGLDTLDSWWKIEQPIEAIVKLVEEYKVEKIVIGLPRNMDGTEGFRTVRTREFIDMLKKYTPTPIIEWDERLTTVMAKQTMNITGVKKKNKKGLVDKIAAVYILQNYLDSLK